MKHLISILIPIRNGEKYIHECIDSIINQTIDNWELIVVNDNSTDNSLNLLKEYEINHVKISVYNNPGEGIIPALQLAYSKSKGNLITRMDADDIMSDNKLEILSKNLLQNGKGSIATGKVKYFSEKPLGNGYKNYETWLNQLTETGSNFQDIYKECVIPSPCWMVYKEDLDKCDAFNPYTYPEDYDLCFRFYKLGLKVVPTNKVLHFWRDYPTRTSRTDDNYADNFFLNLKINYFLELDYNSQRPLELWGAGRKGKEIAKYLISKNISFHWVCNNKNKIGKNIYGVILQSENDIFKIQNPQLIVAVGNNEEQNNIKKIMQDKGLISNQDFFFFS